MVGGGARAGLRSLSPWVLPVTFNRAGLRRLHKGCWGCWNKQSHTLWLKMSGMCSRGWASGCQGGHVPLNPGENCLPFLFLTPGLSQHFQTFPGLWPHGSIHCLHLLVIRTSVVHLTITLHHICLLTKSLTTCDGPRFCSSEWTSMSKTSVAVHPSFVMSIVKCLALNSASVIAECMILAISFPICKMGRGSDIVNVI